MYLIEILDFTPPYWERLEFRQIDRQKKIETHQPNNDGIIFIIYS